MTTTTDERVLTGPRWSSAVMCPRRAFYDGIDAPKAEPDDATVARWRRGKAIEAIVKTGVRAEFREQGRRTREEVEIPWPSEAPIGVGHCDVYIPSETLIVEIVSTAGAALPAHKPLQAAGYALDHPKATQAVVVSIDPSTLDERVYPIDVDGLTPVIRETQALVVDALRTGEPCARVCAHPADGPAFFCPYVETCFAGWERPAVEDIVGLDETAEQLAAATDQTAALEADLRIAKATRDELRDKLRWVVPPGEQVRAGAVTLKRTIVGGRVTLKLSDLRKAGHTLPPVVEEFISIGDESERWTVKRAS